MQMVGRLSGDLLFIYVVNLQSSLLTAKTKLVLFELSQSRGSLETGNYTYMVIIKLNLLCS